VFNFWPLTYSSGETCNDLPLIEVRDLSATSGSRDNRYSASQAEHDAGINAQVGDQVRVSVYFDNGSSDDPGVFAQNTMHNFTVGSTFDTTSTTVHTVAGSLSADNVSTVTSTSAHQGGNITITTPVATQLQYVSGSTQMCLGNAAAQLYGANMSQTCGTDDQGQPKILVNLPDGIANGSVNIGNLPPCFPYSGTVVYTLNVVQSQVVSNGSLAITKQVEDLTYSNNQSYSSSVSAYQNDTVEYKITVSNNSNTTLTGVTMNDPSISGVQMNSGNSTANIGTLSPSQSQTFYLDGQVTANSGTLTNTAFASASNASTVQASASVYVNSPIITPSNGSLTISKQVENLTYGQSLSSSVNAHPGDEVEYQINVQNNGNVVLNNVQVNDPLPSGETFVSSNSNNGYAGNGSVWIGTLYPGQEETITIEATIYGYNNGGSCYNGCGYNNNGYNNNYYGNQTITNTASASANNAATVNASATVYVAQVVTPVIPITPVYPVYPVTPIIPVVQNSNVVLSKSAFNNTKNVDATSVPANKEDFITYTLTATNNGNGMGSNFVFSDDLSNVMNYASMVSLDGGTMNGSTISWPAVNIAANSSVQESFEVRVNYTLPASYNNLQLVNTFGNTVTIQINNPTVITPVITAPKTGPAEETAYSLGFASLLTLGFYIARKKLFRKIA
jgi:uncharacterized repeat protein (TIGR01451 family)